MTSTHRQVRVLVGLLFILALLAAGSVYGAPSGNIIYVKHDAVGNNDGSSWTDAYTDLQDALGIAQYGDEIWVTQGVYYPAPNAIDRTATFELVGGVALYGGFAGAENEREERDWEASVTVLSGDLDRNDIVDENGVVTDTVGILGRNAYNVLTADGVGDTTSFDGFTVTAGLAKGGTYQQGTGGGMRNYLSHLTLANVIFSANYAEKEGGGMYNQLSDPTLTNVTFTHNHSEREGGGMRSRDSSPILTSVTFTGNRSERDGAGMYNILSEPRLTDVTFTGNQATRKGGGMYNYRSSPTLNNVIFSGNQAGSGGGMYNSQSSSPTLTDATFDGNQASSGGGMYNGDYSSPMLTEITFSGNEALYGGAMHNSRSSNPQLTYVTFSGNSGRQGGGISNWNSSPTLTYVTFSGNKGDWEGGGIYNEHDSSPTLTNVTFTGNYSAREGGGMYNYRSSPTLNNVIFSGNSGSQGGAIYNGEGDATLVNVTISGNKAEAEGGAMYNLDSSPALANCILWGNSAPTSPQIHNEGTSAPYVVYSNVEGGYPGEGNIDADPLFVDPVSADEAPTTAGDYRLTEDSPAIDAGTNDMVTVDTDLDGNPRIVDGTTDGNAVVDMGAYEFQIPLLTVTKEGQGLVNSTPAGIDCGTVCTAGFLPGTVVTLTAAADPGWTFSHWTGDCEDTGTCQVTMEDDKSVTAAFTQDEYSLDVTVVGEGDVDLEPDQDAYHYGDVVTLTAIADPGWTFAAWSGAVDSTDNPLALTIQDNTSVTATFTQDEYTLEVDVVGEGSVEVEPDQATYHYGDVVTLRATAELDWTFEAWSGDVVSTENPLHLTMDSDRILTATFQLKTYVITPTAGAGGVITPSTPQTVQHGDDITFTIAANPGYHIAEVAVDGILQGAISSYTFINVTNDHSISAMFALNVPPHFVSADHTAFFVGTAETFTVEATGVPSATIAVSGVLPSGVTFTDTGDGTANLSGTPAIGSAGVYPLIFTASNNVAPDATQSFTLTVKTKVYLPLVLTNH